MSSIKSKPSYIHIKDTDTYFAPNGIMIIRDVSQTPNPSRRYNAKTYLKYMGGIELILTHVYPREIAKILKMYRDDELKEFENIDPEKL